MATTDAVHYGNEDWGGADYAYFGCDEKGNRKAIVTGLSMQLPVSGRPDFNYYI